MKINAQYVLIVFSLFTCVVAHADSDFALLFTKIKDEATAYFADFSGDKAYDEAILFRDGKKQFAVKSLHTILYAREGYLKAMSDSKDKQIKLKAMYNYALLCISLGDVASGRGVLDGIKTELPVARKSLKSLDEVLTKIGATIIPPESLPEQLRAGSPFGRLSRGFDEEVYEEILAKNPGFRIVLSPDEIDELSLNEQELEELETLAEETEKQVNSEKTKACVILLGRSGLRLGAMLKARGEIQWPIIGVPFSGITYEVFDENDLGIYAGFLKKKLEMTTCERYFVIDSFDTGGTLDAFGVLIDALGVPKKNLYALIMDVRSEKSLKRPFKQPEFFGAFKWLSNCAYCDKSWTVKGLLERAYLLPGLGFFPRQWRDQSYFDRALRFDFWRNDQGPVVARHREQMEHRARAARGRMTRELLANPTFPAIDAGTIGAMLANDLAASGL